MKLNKGSPGNGTMKLNKGSPGNGTMKLNKGSPGNMTMKLNKGSPGNGTMKPSKGSPGNGTIEVNLSSQVVGCVGGAFISFVCHRQSFFLPSHTERRDSRSRQDSLTPTTKSSNDLEHEASSVPLSQDPTTSEHEASFSQSFVNQSLSSDSATNDILLQSLVADPHTRARIVAMLREDPTVVRSSSYSTLRTNSSRSRTNTEPEIPLKSLPLEGRSVSLGSIGMGNVHPQPCTTTLQTSDDPCQSYTTFSQTSDEAPSQTSDDPLLSFTATSQTSDDAPSQASPNPSQSRAAIHQTPLDPPQSLNTILQTPDDTTFSLPSAEGQQHRESRESTSSQASSSLGVGSPTSLQSNSAPQQQPSSSPVTSQQQCEGKLV